ncbi:hypothetical protein [Microbispora amethystogenes]|uniref:Uncharacterized protein n=1 Tax=Microbispora amethystogenes TaxID=1427754 RepID=A0ABQ4FJY3_9ACTN|nr:hypothetical protein [Microbispora amethystogenes]GIH35120.1 hypothetical protein Mam01_52840 [Microbispora amethystogenes]
MAADDPEPFVSTARHDRERREETAQVAALLSCAMGTPAVLHALPRVLPWVRHLSGDEMQQFVQELLAATHATPHRVIAEWRATARILASPALATHLTQPLPDDDHSEVLTP